MTFQTGAATDMVDLLSKLSTFATSTHGGWTQGYLNTTNGWFELSKGSLSVSFKWVPSSPQHLSVHQATAFVNTSTAPGKHTGDSNIGFNTTDTGYSNSNLTSERCVHELGDGPFPNYWFFADDVDNDYIHVVVESESTVFRHFGFGTLNKVGDNWTGGEYAYGHYKVQNTSTNLAFNGTSNTFLLDDTSINDIGGTVRVSGIPNQAAGSKYGVCYASTGTLSSSDQDGDPHSQIVGGARGALFKDFRTLSAGTGALHVPLIPIHVVLNDRTNKHLYLLGTQPDVFGMNIENFTPGAEFSIGSDTYIAFPAAQKTESATVNRTYHGGFAYRKVS